MNRSRVRLLWAAVVLLVCVASARVADATDPRRSLRAKLARQFGSGFTTGFADAGTMLGRGKLFFKSVNFTTGEMLKGVLDSKTLEFQVTERSRPRLSDRGLRALVGKHMKQGHGGRLGPIAIQHGSSDRPAAKPGDDSGLQWANFATRDPQGKTVKGSIRAGREPDRVPRIAENVPGFDNPMPWIRAPRRK